MNILVIATGGTIGSTFDGAAINVSAAQSCAVVDLARPEYPDICFDTVTPLNLLSEQLCADDLNTLARVILTTDYAPYDGVIFTVGSDNLGYLVALIGLLTADFSIPVAVVAADKVLADPSSNGLPNFRAAVAVIRRGLTGAYVPYRNADGAMYIHAAADVRQADLSPDFYSMHGAHAVMQEHRMILLQNYIQHRIPPVFDREHLPAITDSVLMIHPYPLLDYTALDVGGKRAVLHMLYHSATLDSERAIGFLRSLGDVPLYLASFVQGKLLYRTAADVIGAGAIPLEDISPESAYMKLLLACAQERMSIRAFMEVRQ